MPEGVKKQSRPLRRAKMLQDQVFASFVFFATLLILKMYAVAILTGQVRLRRKVSPKGTGIGGQRKEASFPCKFLGKRSKSLAAGISQHHRLDINQPSASFPLAPVCSLQLKGGGWGVLGGARGVTAFEGYSGFSEAWGSRAHYPQRRSWDPP